MPDDTQPANPSPLKIFQAHQAVGPDGMPARHVITPDHAGAFDPFIYMAHFGPRELHETSWGFPGHPHKGFETITYMLEGSLEHHDSTGGHAVLNPGDVQWMTAGAGIVHSEIPPEAFQRAGGTVHGFQIWLNLARADKSATPRFQMLRAADMPTAHPADGVTVRVIGGAEAGTSSPVDLLTDVSLIHASLSAGAAWSYQPPAGHNAFAYVFGGAGTVGGATAETGSVALFGRDPGAIALTADDKTLDLLILTGAPIDEPVAAYGPFVMNTRDEIVEAIHDYNAGKMGSV